MKIISYTHKNYQRKLEKLYDRPSYPPEIEDAVSRILFEVKLMGNVAIKKFAKLYDRVNLSPNNFLVDEEEVKEASTLVDSESKQAIKTALTNITDFAKKRIPAPWSYSPRTGVIVGERFEPLDRVAVYIPGGTAPLVSTVIHTAGIAKAAGVKEIVAITPPARDRSVHPAILYALRKVGVSEIYRLGGVYGIAAMAYGTSTIKKVEKIVGPGNAYVTAAKKLVYGEVAIDMVAGPSEIMIIADEETNPDYVAADMLSQAEHGSGHEQAVLVCDNRELIDRVIERIYARTENAGRSNAVRKVLKNGVFLIEARDLDEAAEIASRYAAEHLEILCKQPGRVAKQVRAAGAIFLGQWTPEPVGDFVAGPSHVLPTGGSAKYFNGLSVEHFFRRMSVINYQKSALNRELPAIKKFAEMEGLDSHGNSALARTEPEPVKEQE